VLKTHGIGVTFSLTKGAQIPWSPNHGQIELGLFWLLEHRDDGHAVESKQLMHNKSQIPISEFCAAGAS